VSDHDAGARLKVALLTGGANKPYALGLASALKAEGLLLDFIGSDTVSAPELHGTAQINFFNLRGDQSPAATFPRKALRLLTYYARLVRYAAVAEPRVFHILWNNKFELFDRTLMMLYYRALGRVTLLTVHNVNAGKRDGNDSFLNRLSLRIQYHLSDHIFVHTQQMKRELLDQFGAREGKVSVIPFGINDTIPTTSLTRGQARQALGLTGGDKALLFFGKIAPYKGLDHLIAALAALMQKDDRYRLVIAGAIKDCTRYWNELQQAIDTAGVRPRIIERIGYVPDAEVETYFKAADVLALPYTYIFQSGVLFLSYRFGLPVIATDVGSFREDVLPGRTGFICRARNPGDLAETIETYFSSELFQHLDARRVFIRAYAEQHHSWSTVAQITKDVYAQLLNGRRT
jgi:glycosyltransferase involved in cell wall biosynthesis